MAQLPEPHMIPPLCFGLQHETNRHRIEKPFNFAYNHILTAKSNFSDNDLWTTSEFQAVGINAALAINTTVNRDENIDNEGLGYKEPPFNEDVADRSGSYKGYRVSVSLQPATRQSRRQPRARNASPSPRPATQLEPRPLVPATPPRVHTEPDTPPSNRTIPIRTGIDQSRIADFAVAYLKNKSQSCEIFGVKVPLFEVVYVPIIVEAKRPPSRSELFTPESKRLLEDYAATYMEFGKADIATKQSIFFSAYPSRSYVGIAFAGPWWVFTICTPDATVDTLRWSKAFAYHTQLHDDALNVIFKAAQNYPENPQEDVALVRLLERYEEIPEKTLSFAM
ncbi:hypothetical protein FS749_004171 [Ceratobasidium sp. UAMH 11750]|nr:hypothetical protein FS749_004171 [Ceratobasidium sp. UAMH 11750]